MSLENVELLNFRNFAALNLPIEGDQIILAGPNAQGKTNLLEAVYFSSWGGSFRRILHDDPISWGQNLAKVEVRLKENGGEHCLGTIFKRGQKWQYFLNKNLPLKKRGTSQYLAAFYFAPSIEKYIHGDPSLRRKIFDSIISQKYRNYAILIANYSRLLKGRNYLLKKGKFDDLEVWDVNFIKTAGEIIFRRAFLIKELNGFLNRVYAEISDNQEENVPVGTVYRSRVVPAEVLDKIKDDSLGLIMDILKESLIKQAGQERRFRQTLVGPHRDEFIFLKEGRDLRFFSSRGEGLKIISALKIAQVDFLGKNVKNPVFLVDDLLQDLDKEKSRRFIRAVCQRGPVIVATAHGESLPEEFWNSSKKYLVQGGEIKPWPTA